jgi:UTP--glucose-1-phosphate uridylyltransferase
LFFKLLVVEDMIRKVVIPAAGLGTRLLPATKQQPKEMLPVFAVGVNGQLCLKPLIQLVFEKLYENGFREFCLVVGRGKRSIEDHFTLDNDFIDYLIKNNKLDMAGELDQFYEKVRNANVFFVNQPEPKGFGDAVYHAKPFTGKEAFMVHVGDDFIVSRNDEYLKRLVKTFEMYEADATFCVEKVRDPRKYGVIKGKKIDKNLYQVTGIMEKPARPQSNIAIIAIYVFNERIYDGIEKAKPDVGGEIQLTDGIKQLIDEDCNVYAIELNPNERRIDIGTPKSYWIALNATRKLKEFNL